MLKLLWLSCALCLVASGTAYGDVSAPATQRKSLRVAVLFGLNWATLTPDNDELPEDTLVSRQAISFGGSARFALGDWLTFRPELLYMSKGTSVQLDGSRRGQVVLGYLTIPVLIEVSVPRRRAFRLSLAAGPAINILFNAKTKESFGEDTIIKDERAPIDIGAVINGGLSFEIAPEVWSTIDVRYEHGLLDTDRDAEGDLAKNRTWTVLLGIEY